MIGRLRISIRSKVVASGQRATLAEMRARIRFGAVLKPSGVVIALAQIIAQPVCAQIRSSSSTIVPRRDDKALVDGAIEIRRMADCIVERARNRTALLLTILPGSTDEERIIDSLYSRMSQCMSSNRSAIRFDSTEFRAAVAEASYIKSYAADPDFTKIAHAELPLPEGWSQKQYNERQVPKLFAHAMARCVVAGDPEAAAALVRSHPRGPEERAAIKRIKPLIGPCIVQGSTVSLDASSLRAFIAQEYYRGVKSWAPPAPSLAGGVN